MPGGVDIHAHIAGPKANLARKLSPDTRRADPLERSERLRSGTGGLVPSTFATGYRYSLLGYTTVIEAAAPPLAARHVLAELRDTPMIDKAFLILMGNNQVLFELIRASGGAVTPQLRDAVAWWLAGDRRLRRQARQPRRRRGVQAVRRRRRRDRRRGARLRGDAAPGAGGDRRRRRTSSASPTPSTCTPTTSGCPATPTTTLQTMDALSGRQAHFAHLQFHAYGGKPGGSAAIPRARSCSTTSPPTRS